MATAACGSAVTMMAGRSVAAWTTGNDAPLMALTYR